MYSDSILIYTLIKKIAISSQMLGAHFSTNMRKKWELISPEEEKSKAKVPVENCGEEEAKRI